MQQNKFSLPACLYAFITASFVLTSSSFAQENEEIPTTFPGIELISPAQHATVEPGESVPVNMTIDKSLDPGFVFIMSQMRTGIPALELEQKPLQDALQTNFQGSLQIPNDLAGPQELWVLVKNTADKMIGGLAIKLNVVPTEIPLEIEAHGRGFRLKLPPKKFEGARKVHVKGKYVNDIWRDITSTITGTRYKSSDPQVFTFNDKGVLNPVGMGTAYLIIEHRGLKTFVLVKVTTEGQKRVPPINQTDKVMLALSKPRHFLDINRFERYEVKVTVRNDAALPLSLPLQLVVTGLDKDIKVVENLSETEQVRPIGSPVVFIDMYGRDFLPPGASVEATIRFRKLARKKIDFQLKLYSGSDL